MSLLMSLVADLFPRDVLNENSDLIGAVSEGFSTYFSDINFRISYRFKASSRGFPKLLSGIKE